MNRKQFISNTARASMATAFMPFTGFNSKNDSFDLEQIKELVFAAHGDFDKTKSMIEKSPLLLNCANQGVKGDFETSMGAAAHMGRSDIARLLLDRGARLDIFSLTFLGHIDLVKQLLGVYPQYLTAPGPHGFTLLHHAQVGKHTDFAEWLVDQGLEESRFTGVFG